MKQLKKTLCMLLICCLASGLLSITALAVEPSTSLTAVPTSSAVTSGTWRAVDTEPVRIDGNFLYEDITGTTKPIPSAKVTVKYSNGSTRCSGKIVNGVLTINLMKGDVLYAAEHILEIECAADSDYFPIFSCRNSQPVSIRTQHPLSVGTDGTYVAAIDGGKNVVVPLEISFTAYAIDGTRFPSPLMEDISWQLMNSSGTVTMGGENCPGDISLTFPWEDHTFLVWCEGYQDREFGLYPDFDEDGLVTLSGASRPAVNPNLNSGMYSNSFSMMPSPDISYLYGSTGSGQTVDLQWILRSSNMIKFIDDVTFDIILTDWNGDEIARFSNTTCDRTETNSWAATAIGEAWTCYKTIEMPVTPTLIPVEYRIKVVAKNLGIEVADCESTFTYEIPYQEGTSPAHPTSVSYNYQTGTATWKMSETAGLVQDVVIRFFYNASRQIIDFTPNSPDLYNDSEFGLNPAEYLISSDGSSRWTILPDGVTDNGWPNGYWAMTVSGYSPDAVGKVPVCIWTIGVTNSGDIEDSSGGDDSVEPSGPASSGHDNNDNIPNSSSSKGKVTASPSNPSKGEKVTLSVTPDSGYELVDLIVTDKNGGAVKLTQTSDGKFTFTMPATTVRVEAIFAKIQAQPIITFIDVPADAYYAAPVAWAVENGITAGTSATTFSPDQTCTRAQIITFLYRAAGSPEIYDDTTQSFTDVKAEDYYYNPTVWAAANKVVPGNIFDPNGPCTRAMTMEFIWKSLGCPKPASTAKVFEDVPRSSSYYQAVQWAVGEGITAGTSATTFSPDITCTRAQIMTFLYRVWGV